MKHSELIDAIASKTNETKACTARVITALVSTINESMTKDEEIRIKGLGTFKTSKRSARTGRNPSTGDTLEVPAMKTPTFKASKELKLSLK